MKNAQLKVVGVFVVTVVLASITACGVEKQYEDYKLTTASDISLSSQNHPHGFGKSECFFCHNVNNIHQVDRLNIPSFSLARPYVQQSGLASCVGCHGSNGVP